MSIYNEDELEAPKWLNKDYLENVLRIDTKNDELEIISHEMSPATMKGDHFASCMFRAKITYKTAKNAKDTTNVALIIKTMPDGDTLKNDLLGDTKLFETEISMYMKTLPEIERILAEHGDHESFGPRAIYATLKPRKVIIFEDLCVQGFDCVRGRALRLDELEAIIKKLSKLHAVSYAIGQSEEARKVKKYNESIFSDTKFLEAELLSGGFKRFKKLLDSDDELRVYLPHFNNVQEKVFQECIDFYNAAKNGDEDDIFVLNHGDFHARNIMFKHGEKEKLEDCKMVDFQISIYAPSCLDLTYATFMMFDPVTRRSKRDEMYRFYFEHFIATLKKIEFKGKYPEFAQLQIALLKYRSFAKFLIATFLPMIHQMFTTKLEDIKDINIEENMMSSDALMIAYLNPEFIKELKLFLPIYLNRGYLD